jgi:hypothetical protein
MSIMSVLHFIVKATHFLFSCLHSTRDFIYFIYFFFQEQALYEKEGLNVKRIDWTDNQDCIGQYAVYNVFVYFNA